MTDYFDVQKVLQQYWGYADFRDSQKEVVKSIISGQNTFAILATGGGKSICFQAPGLCMSGLTIVISPLISLMQDQVTNLRKLGVSALAYNSTLDARAKKQALNAIYSKQVKFVYLAPESLVNPDLLAILEQVEVSQVAVDEAHCISIWGHDFRPSYQNIPTFIKRLTGQPIVTAFTATATPKVKQDITANLFTGSVKIFQTTFKRDNITIKVIKSMDEEAVLGVLRERLKLSNILVYSSTRRRCEELARYFFEQLSVQTGAYHGGQEKHVREETQTKFINNQLQIVCATNAFGMGVDKPDLYTVIHDKIPDSIENYFQEIGRAGRDGQPSLAVLNFDWEGVNQRRKMILNNTLSRALANNFYNYFLQRWPIVQEFALTDILLQMENINLSLLKYALQKMADARLINYEFNDDRIVIKNLKKVIFLSRYLDFNKEENLLASKLKKLNAIVELSITEGCRMHSILNYFGEKSTMCNNCDNCYTSINVKSKS